jgi:hypothetical protein
MEVTRRTVLAFLGTVAAGISLVVAKFNPLSSGNSDGTPPAGPGDTPTEDVRPPTNVTPLSDVDVTEDIRMTSALSVDFRNWEWMDQFTEDDPIGNVFLVSDRAYSGQSLSVEIPEGRHYGTSLHYLFSEETSSEPEELWASYYVYFPESFDPKGQVGKLPGPAGTYENAGWGGRPSDGTNGWSARMGFRSAGSDEIGLDYYVYHADMNGMFGDLFSWDCSLPKGRWHRIDEYIRLNDPEAANGILLGWVNGDKAYDRRDVRFRETSELRIEEYWFTVYWGGTYSSPMNNRILFDNLTVRRRA